MEAGGGRRRSPDCPRRRPLSQTAPCRQSLWLVEYLICLNYAQAFSRVLNHVHRETGTTPLPTPFFIVTPIGARSKRGDRPSRAVMAMRHVRLVGAASAEESDALSAMQSDCLQRALGSVRSHLGMDVALVSEFVGDERIFGHVDTRTGRSPIKVGDSLSLERGYCKKIVEGRLPELIPDTSAVPEAMAIPETHEVPIGSHLSVPLRLHDGRICGTLCCFSFGPDVSLNERDLNMMKAFAELITYQIDTNLETVRCRNEKATRVRNVLRSEAPSIVYQPVFRLSDMTILGAEALARFPNEPSRGPDKWFAEAGEVGLKTQLELKAIRSAVTQYASLRNAGSLYLGLNSSPQTIMDGCFLEATAGLPAERIILEVTEHDHVENYDELIRALKPLRARGIQIAIDDAGSGYASMRHILNIHPDFIKLDISLTRHIDADRVRRALARAPIEFGRETDCKIVAEGVENEGEMQTLRDLGVHAAQGFLLSRPISFDDFCLLSLKANRKRLDIVARQAQMVDVTADAISESLD
jgi:EAL domain-containing protein (putative c-di-GMP-specific phosphodiesterase class I)